MRTWSFSLDMKLGSTALEHGMAASRWTATGAGAPSPGGADAGIARLQSVDERLELAHVDAAAVVSIEHRECGLHILVQHVKGGTQFLVGTPTFAARFWEEYYKAYGVPGPGFAGCGGADVHTQAWVSQGAASGSVLSAQARVHSQGGTPRLHRMSLSLLGQIVRVHISRPRQPEGGTPLPRWARTWE